MTGKRFLSTSAAAAVIGWAAIDLYLSIWYIARGTNPLILFQWDAANIVGRKAYDGGYAMGALGLLFDIMVSFGWALVLVAIASRNRGAANHPYLFGIIFGAVVMLVMFAAVVPLGHNPEPKWTLLSLAVSLSAHTIAFGIPMALVVAARLRQ